MAFRYSKVSVKGKITRNWCKLVQIYTDQHGIICFVRATELPKHHQSTKHHRNIATTSTMAVPPENLNVSVSGCILKKKYSWTVVQWMTLPNQTVCDCSHRQDRPPGLTAKGGLAAWDSSAALLLLQFLLSLPSSVSRSHPHSPLPAPGATTQTPWDWPDDTLFQQHIHPLSTHSMGTLSYRTDCTRWHTMSCL